MKSIKRQILIFIVAMMCVNAVVISLTAYIELKREMNELFDENIKRLALAIAVNDLSGESNFISKQELTKKKLGGKEEFLIQIWNKDVLSYSSLPAIQMPHYGEGGVKTIIFNNQEWRYYGVLQDDWLIQVSQPVPTRHIVIWEVYLEILGPILAQLPVWVGVIWFLIGYGFKPLQKISESIKRRHANYLDKILLQNVPSEVRPMVDALNNLLERLERTLKTQREFMADAAHELRSPLTALSLQLDILRRAKTDGERQDAIDALYRGVDRSTHLVQQLLELARQEPDELQAAMQSCDLQKILQSVFQQYEALAQNKNIEFRIMDMQQIMIEGDASALNIMIGNLVNNAILYTQDGGKVELSLLREGKTATMRIADNGAGIPVDERERIFDRFYRIVGTKTDGSGLGLYIAKTIAVRHGAHIEVGAGLDNAGTSFTVIFH